MHSSLFSSPSKFRVLLRSTVLWKTGRGEQIVKPKAQIITIKKYPCFGVRLLERGYFIIRYLTAAIDINIKVETRTDAHWRKGITWHMTVPNIHWSSRTDVSVKGEQNSTTKMSEKAKFPMRMFITVFCLHFSRAVSIRRFPTKPARLISVYSPIRKYCMSSTLLL